MTMQPENLKNESQENILGKIKTGEVKMRPKFYFVSQAVLLGIAAVLLFLIAIFLVSFIMFLGRTGHNSNVHLFLKTFPWILIVASLLLTAILIFILKRYAFAYRWPLIFLPIAVIGIILIASLVAEFYSFHEKLESYAMHRHVPGLAPFYRKSDPDDYPEKSPLNYYNRLQKHDL